MTVLKKQHERLDGDRNEVSGIRIIPLHSRGYLERFVRQHQRKLFRRASRLCQRMGLYGFAEEAVQQMAIRLMTYGRPIEDRGPDSDLRFAMRTLATVCLDELDRRASRPVFGALPGHEAPRGDDVGVRLFGSFQIQPESRLESCRVLRAIEVGLTELPKRVGSTDRTYLWVFWYESVEGLPPYECSQRLGIANTNRTMRARGKRVWVGWITALTGYRHQIAIGNETYENAWHAGYQAGLAYLGGQPLPG